MYNLDNISVKQFWSLQDESLAKQYLRFSNEKDPYFLKPKDMFAGRIATPLGQLTYGEVSNLKHNLSTPSFEGIYECFDAVFKVKLTTYLNQNITSYFYALNWIKEQVTIILERENKTLGGERDPLLEMAGVHRLIPFGELNILKTIAQQFSTTPMEVENWKYNLVYSLMLHDKVSGEVQKSYNELKYGPNKQA